MVKLRFQRLGRAHRPFYRLVAVDARFKRNGRFIEQLGYMNPMASKGEKDLELKEDRIKYWVGVGAQPTDTVADLLSPRGLLSEKLQTQWDRRRAADLARGQARGAVKRAEAAQAALAELESDAEADLGPFLQEIGPLVEAAKTSANQAKVDAAGESATAAEAVLEKARAADAEAKQKKEAEEAAAAAAEAEAAASSEAEAADGEGEASADDAADS
ncbi:MAG: 30S ribosomal protein S16 [Planctomycetota bacterium]